MLPFSCVRFPLLLVLLALVSTGQTAESRTPEITAQGFDITEAQEGVLGGFGRLRVRFEVPDRIAELHIKERSYEVDLAKTPETGNFPLFGLETPVRHLMDVTLNFQTYINQKLEDAGEYVFKLRVIDREGKSTSAELFVRVVAEPRIEQESRVEAVEKAPFRFTRVGASPIVGADSFGIMWKTIQPSRVVIELKKQTDGASKLIEMAPTDYDDVRSKEMLAQKIASGVDTQALQLTTANGEAAGTVFGVVNRQTPYLLKVTESSTSLSKLGTTVTLVGEYKQ